MPTKTDARKNGESHAKAELSPAQLAAVDCLAAGSSVTDAAAAVGVARQTVSEWLNQETAFQAALNRRRAEVWDEQKDRLRALLPKALTTIERAIEEGGPEGLKAALAIVKLAGINLAVVGAVNPEEIEIEDQERERDLSLRRMFALTF